MHPEWHLDCAHYRGRLLTGRYAHFCFDWDGLPIDETCDEWPCCDMRHWDGWLGVERAIIMTRWQRLKFWIRCQRWYPERDKVALWVSRRLPKRLVYWAFIRMALEGCDGNPGEQTCEQVLKRNGQWAH